MIKKHSLIVFAFLCASFLGFGQVKISELTFESAGSYTTSVSEFTDNGTDYFIRTDGSNIMNEAFNNIQGSYYFAAQDTDGDGGPISLTLDFLNINISGYTNLELRVHLAEDDDGTNQDWDDDTSLHIVGTIDSGTTEDLIWVEGSGVTNTAPFIDTNYDGVGDGTEITDTFTQFSQNITGTGLLLDIQLQFENLEAGDEDIAIDNIEIWGELNTAPTIIVNPSSLTGFTYDEDTGGPSGNQSFTVSGTNLTDDIDVSPPTNWEISTAPGGPYQTTPISFSPISGTVSSQTIYTRMVSGLLLVNSPFSGNITATSILDAITENVAVDGTVTNSIDWCNLQSPANGSLNNSGTYNVYARVYESGITEVDGPNAALIGEIGWSPITSDPDPSTWTNWVTATYNGRFGNDHEYLGVLSGLASGKYYYASRFRVSGDSSYTYGGVNADGSPGSIWDGTTYVDGILTVDLVDWCNLQFPATGNIVSGNAFNVYARVYEAGITDASSTAAGANIECWIGYSEIDASIGSSETNSTTRSDFASSDWTWISASYNLDDGNDDEYIADIGSCLPPGNYVYASRFRLYNGEFSYGGITPPNGGSFWDGSTYISGTLTVTDPPLADVVITEIMYNTPTPETDDEWIEICNVSGSVQDISNYTIDVSGGSVTVYTFPCNTTIADGACITINLGDGSGTNFNVDCPFTADYISGNPTGTLGNTSDTITLKASNGTTVDEVTYDDGDDSSTDGNGSSYHIIDISLDNSTTSSNWQAVAYGGSPGLNTLVPNCVPMVVEINVEGNLGAYPDIPDDDAGTNTPIGTNNTLFAAQFVGSTQSKSYRIQNLGGSNLNLTSVSLIGADPGEFNISLVPTSPVIYGTPSILEITFAPTSAGIKNAIVEIVNNDDNTDGDTEEVYTFNIRGEGLCVGVIDSITPASGPEGTIVTVSATGIDLSTASANFNGVSATVVNYISATDKLEVTVPANATTGNLEIADANCTALTAFAVIDTRISSCGGSGNLTDLIMTEVTDATTGGLTYIEIYNGTGSAVSLNGYSLEIFSNGSSSGNSVALDNVSLANGSTHVVAIGVASSPDTTDPGANTCPIVGDTGGNGHLADQTSTLGGINKKDNEHDMIRLVYSGSTVDEFGVYQDNDWMDATIVTGNRGFNFRRLNTVAAATPKPVFDITDWNVIDWVGSGLTSCSTNDYSDIGTFDFSTGSPPTVDSGPTINSSCNSATIEVSGMEGTDPAGLAYQWYYNIPNTTGWVEILNTNTDYTGQQSTLLTILDTSSLEGYQYYCQIREDDEDCYSASDAVQLTLPTTTWDGSSWSNGFPDSNKIAIIDGNFDTGIGSGVQDSFSACNLIVNSGSELIVDDDSYVSVVNDVIIYGEIIVRTSGSFVQVNDSGTFTLDPDPDASAIVEKETAEMNQWYEYTYWSSPIQDGYETIDGGLSEADTNRRFLFNAQNYRDSVKENGNSNNYTSGHDDIDDPASEMDGTGTDWEYVSGSAFMTPGVGYASTHSLIGFNSIPCSGGSDCQFKYTFEGPFNTGDISVPVYRNDDEMADNNWNFLGNPYPSAINADLFLDENAVIDTVDQGSLDKIIYFWSQTTPPSRSTNGNQVENFSQADYAIINATTETAGGDGIPPDRSIPSGQGFFISYANVPVDADNIEISASPKIIQGTVTFTNSMRITGLNSKFFREAISKNASSHKNILKLNLTSDNGVFNQIAIGYVDGATDNFDGLSYDAPKKLSTGSYSGLYSLIENNDKKFAIQGKDPNSLDLDETIALGFDTSIDVTTLYKLSIAQIEGDFFNDNTIYLRDYEMNIIHNLSKSDYTFTSEVGEFKDRFEIVFQDTSLSTDEFGPETSNVSIIELDSDNVKFKASNNLEILNVKIFDVLGRQLYDLKGNRNVEIYNLSSLSQATYIARIELSNGSVITKKAVKK